jgi:hypothetical protein
MNPLSVECEVHFHTRGRGRKGLEAGAAPPAPPPGRAPRVARLLALAHRLDRLLRTGVVRDYAELARLGHVTRARISQVMALLLLARTRPPNHVLSRVALTEATASCPIPVTVGCRFAHPVIPPGVQPH